MVVSPALSRSELEHEQGRTFRNYVLTQTSQSKFLRTGGTTAHQRAPEVSIMAHNPHQRIDTVVR